MKLGRSRILAAGVAAAMLAVLAAPAAADQADYLFNNGPYDGSAVGGPVASAPSAVYSPQFGEAVYWRGSDGSLQEMSFDAAGWHGPTRLNPGPLGSAPSAASTSGGDAVFWRGSDGLLMDLFNDGTGWQGPVSGGAIDSAPSAVYSARYGNAEYWRAADGSLQMAYYLNGNGHGPVTLFSGPLGSAPAALSGGGVDAVFWRGPDGSLQEMSNSGAGWTAPTTVLAPSGTTQVPVPPPSSGRKPRLRVRITLTWTWTQLTTRLDRVRFLKLPRSARIALTCAGEGCPWRRVVFRAARLRRLRLRLEDRSYRAGDRLRLTISRAGYLPDRVKIEIRPGRIPRIALVS